MNLTSRFRVSAILGAILMAGGFIGMMFIPGAGTPTDRDFTDFYASDGRLTLAFLSALVMIVGCWCLIWFFNELRARLPDGILGRAAHGIAMIGIAGLAIGAVITVAPAAVQINSSTASFVGIPIANTFVQAGIGATVLVGMYSLLVATVLFCIALRQSNLVPSWLSTMGFIAAIVMLGSFILTPALIFPIWLIVLGLVGVRLRTGSS